MLIYVGQRLKICAWSQYSLTLLARMMFSLAVKTSLAAQVNMKQSWCAEES